MKIQVFEYEPVFSDAWDEFVLNSSFNGTFLHTRRFLSYHKDRFIDCSLLIRDNKGRIIAVFPAALHPSNASVVVSHPGITYGGVVSGKKCRGEIMVNVMKVICSYFAANGFICLKYRAVPHIYPYIPMQDDIYALFNMGAKPYRFDLSSVIDLDNRGRICRRRKNGYKKAKQAGVIIAYGEQYAAEIWNILSANLKTKHSVEPVHSIDEILLLYTRFPKQINFVAALFDNQVVAGIVLFQCQMVVHAQYAASNETGKKINALDMIFENCISEAATKGARYFDFGISNASVGLLNEGLFLFKHEFGAGTCVHEIYEIDLESPIGDPETPRL